MSKQPGLGSLRVKQAAERNCCSSAGLEGGRFYRRQQARQVGTLLGVEMKETAPTGGFVTLSKFPAREFAP